MRLTTLRRQLEFGDLLISLYIVVFVRQFAWTISNDYLAWAITLIFSAVLWVVYLRTKPDDVEKTPRAFWLIVALPLFLVFLIRLPFPDLSFDVLNHRLVQSERALRGVQFLPGDFFPSIFPFNPAPDMLTGITRHLLGYRLGTIINLLALVWAGTIIEKILRPFVRGTWLRCAGVLLVLLIEHALFEINNYMVDLLALPLTLEALRLALNYRESKHRERDLFFSAILLGASLGLKLTNAAVAVPVLTVFAVQMFSQKIGKREIKLILVSAGLFLLPLLPHAIYIYWDTGSPVFPLYNNLIKSSYWPPISPYDGRWGPRGWAETLFWPVLTASNPDRLSELGVYSGRLVLGIAAAFLCLFLPGTTRRARLIALALLFGSILWSLTSGYIRYALFVEVLSGVLIIYLASYVYERFPNWARPLRLAATALLLCLLGAQGALAAYYVSQTEWSRRPTLFNDSTAFGHELRWIWRDRDLISFQTKSDRELLQSVDGWIVSGVKSNGVQVLLRPDVPMLAINNLEYFMQPRSKERFAAALEGLRGKHMFSLTLTDELDASLNFIRQRGLFIGETKTLVVPFFSADRRIHMTLIEIRPLEKGELPQRNPSTAAVSESQGPLIDDAFNAGLSVIDVPTAMKVGEKATIQVLVKNQSTHVWPARGQKDGKYSINVADSWFNSDDDTLVNNMDGRTTLPRDLWPNESVEVALTITAPAVAGEYKLEIDLVQEGVTFFKAKGSQQVRYKIKVE